MRLLFCAIGLTLMAVTARTQQMTIAQMKSEIEKSPNSPLYVKQVLKKRFKIDSIVVARTRFFNSLADSIAYTGKVKAVYGPFQQKGSKFLVQVLAKAPNTFFHLSQIFIDTSFFTYRVADSLGMLIMKKLHTGADSFEHLAQTYSMGGESAFQGDIGWVAEGALLPPIEAKLMKMKKGEVAGVWTKNGLHIIKKTDDPKQDTGFALLLRVFL
jgi:PPIC-type PPIASE domain